VSRLPASAFLCVAILSLGGGKASHAVAGRVSISNAQVPALAHAESASCPAGTLPDGAICVRLSEEDDSPELESYVGAHRDRDGRWVAYDQIPRRPDRPADYDLFRYPVPCHSGCVVSGYDLDRPDELQRRGRRMRHVGHGAIDILEPRGTAVTLLALEHQQGDADLVYVGPLFGISVVTHHTIREARGLREYLLVFGHLAAPAAALSELPPGARLHEGDLIGFVGDTASPGLVHLHMEVRRLREGIGPKNLGPARLVDNAISIACDPRNVLPLK
jgi:hypothetical protein